MASRASSDSTDGSNHEAPPAPLRVVYPAEGRRLPQSDSESEDDDDEIATPKPQKLSLASKSFDEVSDCSSPSASAFVIQPSSKPQQPSDGKKKQSALKKYSDEEEIALLEGLAEFWADGRNNRWAEFHKFVQGRLPREFTKIQISEKVRGLKRKYDNNETRARLNGGRVDISDEHELALFKLSQKLWDDDVGIPFEAAGNNGKDGSFNSEKESVPKKRKRKAAASESNEEKQMQKRDKELGKEEEKQAKKQKRDKEFGKEDFESKYPLLCESFASLGSPKFVRDICRWMGRDNAMEFEEKWMEIKTLELRLKRKRIELAEEDL